MLTVDLFLNGASTLHGRTIRTFDVTIPHNRQSGELMVYELDSYRDFWESGHYVLVKARNPLPFLVEEHRFLNYIIYNTKTYATVSICDDRIALVLVRKMFEAGVPVLDKRPPGQHYTEAVFAQTASAQRSLEETKEILGELVALERQGSTNEELLHRLEEIRTERGW